MHTELKESEILRQMMDVLRHRHIFFHRNNTGRRGGVSFGSLGSPDLIACIAGKYVAIEAKTLKGEQSRKQTEFQVALEAAGGIYILAHSALELDQEIVRRFL